MKKENILQSAVIYIKCAEGRRSDGKETAGPSQQARFEATSTPSASNDDVQPSFPKFINNCLTYYTNSKSIT